VDSVHELALCRSISAIALRASNGARVSRVDIDVGALRQVVPTTLTSCWRIVRRGTPLADAELAVRHIPAVIACDDCGAQTQLSEPYLICGQCASTQVHVLAGKEFLVRSLEVMTDESRRDDGQIPPA
jgi:hydrogenase nickel incorporation protein HypA/HybF